MLAVPGVSRLTLRFADADLEAQFERFYTGPKGLYSKLYVVIIAFADLALWPFFLHTGPSPLSALGGAAHPPADPKFDSATLFTPFMLPFACLSVVTMLIMPLILVPRLERWHRYINLFVYLTHWPAYSLAHMQAHNTLPSLFLMPACAGFCTFLSRQRFIFALLCTGLYPALLFITGATAWWRPLRHPLPALYLVTYVAMMTGIHYVSEVAWRRCFLQKRNVAAEVERFTAEKAKTERQLCALFPSTVVQQIAASSNFLSIITRFDDACVVATDVVSFTDFSSRVSSAELVSFLNLMFARFDLAAQTNGMEKVHTIGDAVIFVLLPTEPTATPGAGADYQNAAYRSDPTQTSLRAGQSILFALDLQLIFAGVIEEIATRMKPPGGMRVGVHVGALCGAFVGGVRSRLQYDFFGDAMRVAGELEATGRAGAVHISDQAWQCAAASPDWPAEIGAPGPSHAVLQSYTRPTWLLHQNDSSFAHKQGPRKSLQPIDAQQSRAAFENLASHFASASPNDACEYAQLDDFGTALLRTRFTSPRTNAAYQRFLLSPESVSQGALVALPVVLLGVPFGILALAPLTSRNLSLFGVTLAAVAGLHATGSRLVARSHEEAPVPRGLLLLYMLALCAATLPGFATEAFPVSDSFPADQVAEYQRVVQMSAINFFSVSIQLVTVLPVYQRFALHCLVQASWAFGLLLSPDAYSSNFTAPLTTPGYFALIVSVIAGAWLIIGVFFDSCYRWDFVSYCEQRRHHSSVHKDYVNALGTVLQLMLPPSVLLRLSGLAADEPASEPSSASAGAAPKELSVMAGDAAPAAAFHRWGPRPSIAPLGIAGNNLRGVRLMGSNELTGGLVDDIPSATCVCFKVANTQSLGPAALALVLQRLWRTVDGMLLAKSNDVFKVKSVGPFALFVAGALQPLEPGVHCSAALSVVRLLIQAVRVINNRCGTDLHYTIGMHTGALTGAVLGKTQLIYDTFGDTINLSSRMQSTAEPNTVQVTPEVISILGSDSFTERGEVAVKGRGVIDVFVLNDDFAYDITMEEPQSPVHLGESSSNSSSQLEPSLRKYGWQP